MDEGSRSENRGAVSGGARHRAVLCVADCGRKSGKRCLRVGARAVRKGDRTVALSVFRVLQFVLRAGFGTAHGAGAFSCGGAALRRAGLRRCGAFCGAHGRVSVRRAERGRALWRRKHRSENSKKASSFLQQLRPCVYLRRCRAISLWKQPCGAAFVSRACCIFPFARHFRPKKRPYAGKDRPGRRKRSVRFLLIRADRERQKIGADSAGGLHVHGRLRRCDGDGANGAPAGSPRLGTCDCIGAS